MEDVRGKDMKPIQILIADDEELLRSNLRYMLESRPGWRVCAEAEDGLQAVEKAKQLRPHVVVMDVSMPTMDGIHATRIIQREVPEAVIVLISQNDPRIVSHQAAEIGADGYVPKSNIAWDLVPALDAAIAARNGGFKDWLNEEKPNPRSEPAVSESEQRFREMIDAIPAAIYTTDAEGRLTHFNPAAVELAGRRPELGTDSWCVSWKLFWPDGTPLPHDQCPMAIALKEGRVLSGVEVQLERPDGSRVWIAPYPRALRNADGKLVGGVNMLLDITERKQAERANNLLASIVASSDDAIVSKTLDGTITSWNKSAERMFGYTAEEAVGQNIRLIIPRERWDEEAEILARLRSGQRIDHFHTVRRRKDGTTLDVSLTISPLKDANGRVVGASKVARDISEEKRAQEALQESEERFRKLSHTLDGEVRARTTDALRQAEQVRQLSAYLLQAQDEERRRIARELHDSAGQSLTILGMSLHQMAEEARQVSPQFAKRAAEAEELIQRLTQEVRTTSYLLHPPLLDESGLFYALNWYIQGLMERSGLEIILEIPQVFGRLPRDMELTIFRLVQECLTNVHRHSRSKTASIRIGRDDHMVTLEVQDRGVGISPEKLAEIQSGGSGVGIRGMRERVHQFHGALNTESDSTGTRVFVTIPNPRRPVPKEHNRQRRQQAT
ncbi:MAG: PAS domain S-box protein [Candidatus Korobacteraceae bacterium]